MVIRDKIKERQTIIKHVEIEAMIADLLAKVSASKVFNEHIISMCVPTSFGVLS